MLADAEAVTMISTSTQQTQQSVRLTHAAGLTVMVRSFVHSLHGVIEQQRPLYMSLRPCAQSPLRCQ